MRVLLTAIGSMSAECVINKLHEQNNFVVGCDIYPAEWHYESKICDKFYRAPFATEVDKYINFLLTVCRDNKLQYLIPLTDLEIDIINANRKVLNDAGIVLCMQSEEVLAVARDKYKLYSYFADDDVVSSIKTCLLSQLSGEMTFPCIAKPYNGRSSEGLLRNASREQVMAIEDKEKYIIQEQLSGDVFTVDYCRSEMSGKDAAVPRCELLRTKNGAGLTVKIVNDSHLLQLVSHIGAKLHINGCVNMEFIGHEGKYYLIDINPRYSAGVAFSVVSGYDMVSNHLRCFVGEDIEDAVPIQENVIIKKFVEVVM